MTATVQLKPTHPPQLKPVVSDDAALGEFVFGKLPPQSLELEQAVLGAVMLDKEAFPVIYEILSEASFYRLKHGLIFKAALALWTKTAPIDLLTVMEELKKQGELDNAGGPSYLSELTNRVASAANIEHHARIIQQKHIRRRAIEIGGRLIGDGYDDTKDPLEIVDCITEEVFSILEDVTNTDAKTMAEIGAELLRDFDEKINQSDGLTGLPVNIPSIDRFTGGWQRTDLIIIAARPGMGKTSFVVTMALNAAKIFDKPIAIFSLEMSALQLQQKMISMLSGIPMQKIRNPKSMEEHETAAFMMAFEAVTELPIYIDDAPGLSPYEIRSKARKLKRKYGIEGIVVDYLQLMSMGDKKSRGNREQEVSTFSRELKGLAKELNVPVLALSQLSRAVETRGGTKRPMLSDLRESGAIEQDADIVSFIYRPEYYDILEDEEGENLSGLAEVIVAKNRHGKLGTIRLKFNQENTMFGELDDEFFPEMASTGKQALTEAGVSSQFPVKVRPAYDTYEQNEVMVKAREQEIEF